MAQRKAGRDVDWENSLLHGVVFYIFGIIAIILFQNFIMVDAYAVDGIAKFLPLVAGSFITYFIIAIPFFFMGFISRAID